MSKLSLFTEDVNSDVEKMKKSLVEPASPSTSTLTLQQLLGVKYFGDDTASANAAETMNTLEHVFLLQDRYLVL